MALVIQYGTVLIINRIPIQNTRITRFERASSKLTI